jgi:hypothetical protein
MRACRPRAGCRHLAAVAVGFRLVVVEVEKSSDLARAQVAWDRESVEHGVQRWVRRANIDDVLVQGMSSVNQTGLAALDPCIPRLAASRSSADRASSVRAIVSLLSRSWKNSPRFPRCCAQCRQSPRKSTAWRDAHVTFTFGAPPTEKVVLHAEIPARTSRACHPRTVTLSAPQGSGLQGERDR